MKKSIQLFTFLLILSHFSLNAQQNWTLKICVDTAYKKNISINQAQLSSRVNKISMEQSKTAVLPTLNFNDAQSLNAGYSLDPFTYQYTT